MTSMWPAAPPASSAGPGRRRARAAEPTGLGLMDLRWPVPRPNSRCRRRRGPPRGGGRRARPDAGARRRAARAQPAVRTGSRRSARIAISPLPSHPEATTCAHSRLSSPAS
jgi:hypothetical protein